jgi:MFS family permease
MHLDHPSGATDGTLANRPWWRELTRYHWFVFIVAAVGWMADCMDQQIFTLARVPAMRELVPHTGTDAAGRNAQIAESAGYSTSIFLIGWATGGLFFGIMGDRYGRVRTLLLTILVYSIFTGLSALSQGFWDFALWRFLSGLGVGGEFAVGVALVAEVMPPRSRPYALGLLQSLSAVGNVTAALLSMSGMGWRWMFLVGAAPALLSVFVRRRLKEPERWQAVSASEGLRKQLGSFRELLGDPVLRQRALLGLLLASSGVIGLWGIGFFAVDLNRLVFRKHVEAELRAGNEPLRDRHFVRLLLHQPDRVKEVSLQVAPSDLLDPDAQAAFSALLARSAGQAQAASSAVHSLAEAGIPPDQQSSLAEHLARIQNRSKSIGKELNFWAGVTALCLNFGGFFGIYLFSYVSHYLGRRGTFVICFLLAACVTAFVFWFLGRIAGFADIFWMIPLMGFCQLSLFGGYAIYFPELFPTRLRSTGTSFCYNIGRFAAALGPSALGLLTSRVFVGFELEPMRYAGVTLSAVFLVGMLALPGLPETKGQPLPE